MVCHQTVPPQGGMGTPRAAGAGGASKYPPGFAFLGLTTTFSPSLCCFPLYFNMNFTTRLRWQFRKENFLRGHIKIWLGSVL